MNSLPAPVALRAVLLLFVPVLVFGHVGSPDIFLEGPAGPYTLTVVVRPPTVIPGVAQVEVLVRGDVPSGDIRVIRIQPVTYRTKELAGPVPDELRRSKSDARFFTGEVWLMTTGLYGGSYNIRVMVEGARGGGQLDVPVPALASSIKTMQPALGALLGGLLLFLVVGLVSMIGAAARDGGLPPGAQPGGAEIRRGRAAMAAAFFTCVAILWLGYLWWGQEADAYAGYVYTPLEMTPRVLTGSGSIPRLSLEPKGSGLRIQDWIEDHGHLMHLFLVRSPEMDAFYHIHPDRVDAARYERALPALPAGRYKLFAEIVHQSGLPETMVAQAALPEITQGPLEGDDSGFSPLPDGVRIVWDRPAKLLARQPVSLTFRVEPGDGLEPYMGMAGHAVIARRDLSVFAHLHPMGSVSMASLQVFRKPGSSADHPMAHHIAPAVSFPYGFPQPGSYRIWVQVKQRGRVLTAAFDSEVQAQ